MAADPKTIPAAIVAKIKDVIQWRHIRLTRKSIKDTTSPFYVTATLQIDPVTGKILDAFFVRGWTEGDGKWEPIYSVVHQTYGDEDNRPCSCVYGQVPKPIRVLTLLNVHTDES